MPEAVTQPQSYGLHEKPHALREASELTECCLVMNRPCFAKNW